jgi:hypothetical protein
MNWKKLLLFGAILAVLGVVLCCNDYLRKEPVKESSGDATFLQTRLLKHAQYDGDDGRTEITVLSKVEHKRLKKLRWKGVWHCVGYIRSSQAFLLVGEFQVGAWLPLTKIRYLSAEGNEAIDSRCQRNYPKSQEELGGWMGFSVIPNDDLSFISFIGCFEGSAMSLMVLDAQKDELKVLGAAPAPPPISDPYWLKEVQRMIAEDHEWAWGGPGADGYIPMDDGVIVYKDDKLIVSYGDDTPVRRAVKRTYKTWDLNKVFGEKGPGSNK